MLIIAGHVTVDAGRREEYVAAHVDLVRRCRAAPGCLDVAISPDPLDPTRVNLLERWASRDDLEAWRAVANAPDTGIAFTAGDVLEFDVADARPPVFGQDPT